MYDRVVSSENPRGGLDQPLLSHSQASVAVGLRLVNKAFPRINRIPGRLICTRGAYRLVIHEYLQGNALFNADLKRWPKALQVDPHPNQQAFKGGCGYEHVLTDSIG